VRERGAKSVRQLEARSKEIKMKIRRSTALIATLAIMTLALAAACSQGPSTNSNGAGSSNNANASNNRATATPTPAATTSASLSTPTNTFMAFYEASKKNDVEGVKRTLSKDSLEFLTAAAKQENKSLEVALNESLKKADVPTTTPEVRNEKIDGERATLEVKDDKSGSWEPFSFVRENAEWKIRLGAE
jgi:hypothetical protein